MLAHHLGIYLFIISHRIPILSCQIVTIVDWTQKEIMVWVIDCLTSGTCLFHKKTKIRCSTQKLVQNMTVKQQKYMTQGMYAFATSAWVQFCSFYYLKFFRMVPTTSTSVVSDITITLSTFADVGRLWSTLDKIPFTIFCSSGLSLWFEMLLMYVTILSCYSVDVIIHWWDLGSVHMAETHCTECCHQVVVVDPSESLWLSHVDQSSTESSFVILFYSVSHKVIFITDKSAQGHTVLYFSQLYF